MRAHLCYYRRLRVCLLACLLIPAFATLAQDKPSDAAKPDAVKESEKKSDENASKKPKIKKYDEVITKEAVSKVGLFRVHRIDESLYYEIPPDALDTDLLW